MVVQGKFFVRWDLQVGESCSLAGLGQWFPAFHVLILPSYACVLLINGKPWNILCAYIRNNKIPNGVVVSNQVQSRMSAIQHIALMRVPRMR